MKATNPAVLLGLLLAATSVPAIAAAPQITNQRQHVAVDLGQTNTFRVTAT